MTKPPAGSWYVLQTRPFKESYVQSQLSGLSIETYCPLMKTFKRYLRNGQRQVEPFFPGYIFARIEKTSDLFVLRGVREFKRFVSFGAGPACVAHSMVEDFRRREDGKGHICVRPLKTDLQVNDSVEIVDGPFRGHISLFVRYLDGRKRVCVLLEMLHRQTPLELPVSSVSTAVTSDGRDQQEALQI
jgi:transcriptional antiterminator RfaH